jgi:biofilm protein TabA
LILDELTAAARYEKLHAGFRAGFEFLKQTNLASLESGRHEIEGDQVFALINRDPGRGRAGARLEAHRKYIDIQFLVSGQEEIGWRRLAECSRPIEPFNVERDIIFFEDEPLAWIVLPVGKFMIFYPQDAHAPLAAIGDNLKAVIKVAV